MSYYIERDDHGRITNWLEARLTVFPRESDAASAEGWCEQLDRGTAKTWFCADWSEA